MNKKIMSGSFWLSFGSIFSRMLGVLYLIPWLYMIGVDHQSGAQALNNSSYQPYALFISLATAGFPSAVARRIAMYNGQNKFLNAKRFTKLGFWVMLASGVVSGIVLYLIAPIIAKNSPVVSVKAATTSIRVLVPAIVIIPSMSITRGWFQGNQDLKPYGVSQLWEQFIRVIFILVSTYIIINVFHKSFVIAVYYSVFGAVVGAIASYIYLGLYYKKQSSQYAAMAAKSLPDDLSGVKKTLLTIVYESIPFVIVGSGITITQLIDQLFFKQVMQNMLHKSAEFTQYIYTLFSANPTKVTTVVVSLAISVAETTLPLLAQSKSAHKNNIGELVVQNLNLLLFALLPAITILSALSYEINGVIFNFDLLGGDYLFWNIIQSLALGMAINGLTLLQALHYSKKAMYYLISGILIKLVLQVPLVYWLQGFGAILATTVAFGLVSFLSIWQICRDFHVKLRNLGLTLGLNIVFFAVMVLASTGLNRIYLPTSKIEALIAGMIFGLIGLVLYLFFVNETGLSQRVFNKKIGYKYFRYKHFE
ncbi:polysaccharide biosynthesis protein [Lentilactobacillus diolivorans]|uniref:putative polysaccharide biosynthesis protein n=1 Tax=Lentilactobacillus diolivorans TaxID=179838 RepID=UPI000FF1C1E8|nr:polysaccharide biosynthesis protein [Lentilactobacillus diolivorans]MDH5106943.1 polysaccharide biosynthesis protein [Lentilactobacillus diolivorans]RRG01987.1 MAG: polysaccharide biosynthesis protein [Lactobacillus sp.]